MSRRLAAAALVAAAAFAASVPSHAAPAPQITDASGDAVGGQAALDIVTVRFSTTGLTTVTKVRGKRVTTYTPTKLVVTQTLAGAPSTTLGTRYRIEATVDGCGQFDIYYVNGASGPTGSAWFDCPEGGLGESGTLLDVVPKISGSTMTWELPLKTLPREVKVGSVLSAFRAYTDLGDPLTGILGTGEGAANLLVIPNDPTVGVAVADVATGTGVWKIG